MKTMLGNKMESEYERGGCNLEAFRRWMADLQGEAIIIENVPVILLVAGYVLAVTLVHAAFGIHGKILYYVKNIAFVQLALTFAAIFMALHLRNKSYRRYINIRSLTGFVTIIVLMSFFQCSFVSYKQAMPLINGFRWDLDLMKLDRFLHFGFHPWQILSPLLAYPEVIRWIDRCYMTWFYIMFLFCFWMAWTQRRHLRLRFFFTIFGVWSLLGSGFGTIFSSAGPCYYSKVVSVEENPFEPLMTQLGKIDQKTFLRARLNQDGLWESQRMGLWRPFGGISAMPSIHVAIAMVLVLASFKVHRWLGVVFTAYLCLILIGSIILGWHYAADGYAGIIFTAFIWHFAGKITSRITRSRPDYFRI